MLTSFLLIIRTTNARKAANVCRMIYLSKLHACVGEYVNLRLETEVLYKIGSCLDMARFSYALFLKGCLVAFYSTEKEVTSRIGNIYN
jgi:hypothetical protein